MTQAITQHRPLTELEWFGIAFLVVYAISDLAGMLS